MKTSFAFTRPARTLAPLALAAALAGCSMAPKYDRPAAPIDTAYPLGAAYVEPAAATPDDAITAEMAAAHAEGKYIARLHSGDLSVWSAMGEQIRRLQLLQRGAKGLLELLGQLADEAHGVGQDDLVVAGEAQPAAGRVQGGEKPVLG